MSDQSIPDPTQRPAPELELPPTNLLPAIPIELPALPSIIAEHERGVWTSWTPDTAAEAASVYNARNGPSLDLDDYMGHVIDVIGWTAHRVPSVDPKTGEVSYYPRCVLIGPDSQLWSSCAVGIIESLIELTRLQPLGRWSPPLRLKPRAVKTRAGRTTHKLEWVQDLSPAPPKGGRTRGA